MLSNKKILIVEDEILLSYTINEMLEEFGYQSTVIANKFEEAREIIKNHNDIILAILDINLVESNEGISLAKDCYQKEIPFIFLTSYTDPKTLNLALETEPQAYLVKPVNPTELYSAVNIIIKKSAKDNAEFIFKDGTDLIRLKTNEISHVKSDGIYVEIHTVHKKYLHRNSLINVLEQLPEHAFTQTHRSYAVNNAHVRKVRSKSISIGTHEIPISRTFKESIKERLT